MKETALILGANGRFGRVVARAFADAGWNVVAQARKPLVEPAHPRIKHLCVAVTDRDAVVAVAAGPSVVVQAMNPLYTNWDAEAVPLNAAAIAIARSLDAALMLPGNVYNFGSPMPAELTERTAERPINRKGEIRCQMEAAMRAGAPRSIVIRAGDFFGGPGTGSWMDQAIVKDLAKGRITYPGPRNLQHAWAFLPDLARTFVLVAEARGRLAPHDSFHFPGHTVTGDELVAGITRAARRAGLLPMNSEPVVRGMPWTLVRMAGLFNPLLRELAKMSYLWREPHRLAGAKLKAAIGAIPCTPLDEALDTTLSELHFPMPRDAAVAQGAA
jgi:nucleoside-diphosphate-sugar epimerase